MLADNRSIHDVRSAWRDRWSSLPWRIASASACVVRWLSSGGQPQSPQRSEPEHSLQVPTDGPRDCVLILDRSGSMGECDWRPSRIDGAKQAAQAFVDRLAREEASARVAIVAYSSEADTCCSLTPVLDVDTLRRAITRIRPGGNTNITAGLKATHALLCGSNKVHQVVLLSDGYHNTGGRPFQVAEQLKTHAIVECVGIGGKPNKVHERLLKSIASCYPDGSKRYRWIGDPERLVEHFYNLAGRITRA